ncbi:MAG: C25 family cysteine peptidase [Candidatus Heimdallarchaeota archaeon]
MAKSRDTMGFCVDTDFYGMYRITVNATGKVFDYVNIPGAKHFTQPGKPAVPVVTRFLEIPYNYDPQMNPISLSYEIMHAEYVELDGYYLTPAQEERVDLPNATDPEYKFDDVIYNTDSFFPGKLVTLAGHNQSIILRGHRILGLNLNPIQFNPVTRKIRAYSKIEVRINYDRAVQIKPIPSRLFNLNFHEMLEDLILNYDYSPSWKWLPYYTSVLNKKTGAEYLIITHDDFYNEIKPLAIWKEKKGVATKIVKTSEIDTGGPTADDIKDYIKNAYETWDPVPAYVLLVGDSEFIPTHYYTPHPYSGHGGFEIATDLYYATVDGEDYFPDLYIGRLSVDTPLECSIVVDKILNYEKNPPNNANFYNSAAFCAYFQDSGDTRDGYEDRAFILTSEQIRDYLIREGYNVHRIYVALNPGGQNPTNYNNGPNIFYDSGDPLPADLLWPGFRWDGDRNDITNNITDGRFLIFHRDHGVSDNFFNHRTNNWGGMDGWGDPEYHTGDIAGLANGDLLPVVLSIECQCGWFDGEIDQNNDADLTHNFESFCEMFVRQNGGGAIAAIGASRSSYSGLNEDFAHGLFDAIWPGFNPDFAGGELFQLGQILTYGKIYLAALRGYSADLVQETFELFHLFGCPEMSIYTKEPKSMTVTFPDTIGSGGAQKFVVKVQSNQNPLSNVKICLQKDDKVYAVKYTNAFGNAYFSVRPENGGEMNITVTKHNYIPYEDIITVTDNGAAISIDPDTSYPGYPFTLTGGGFSSSETVNINFGSTTFTKTATTSGSISLSDDIPTLAPGEIINIEAVGQSSGRTAVCMFRCLSEAQTCDPYFYSQWDSTTWHLNPLGNDPRWDNPEIQLYEQGTWNTVASNELEVGRTYTIRATIHNNLDVEATNTEVTFKWAFFGAGQKTWNLIGTDTIDVPTLGTKIAEVDWTPSITGHNCIAVFIDQYWDENTKNNKGQENTHVAPASSSVEISFTLHNPRQTSELIYLETKFVEGPEIWPATITRDYPQILGPNQEYEVILVIDVPEKVNNDTSGYYVVNAYIGNTLIGGIEVKAIKSTSGGKTNPFSVPIIAVVCAIVIEQAFIIWLQRKRKLKNYQT